MAPDEGDSVPEVGEVVLLRPPRSRQLVKGRILKIGRFFVWVRWGVRESWDGTPPFRHYETAKWVRHGRIIQWASTNPKGAE